ncbi:MAG TPA: hypothetical protein VGG85_02005 [Terracidiphilus sp.]|jgi:hypothetical protein
MKKTPFVLAVIAAAALQAAAVEPRTHSPWVGVWQGELDGLPGVTVTLGDDAGDIGGSVVFNVIMKENGAPYIGGHDAHVLTHLHLDGDTLSFEVIRLGDGRDLHFTVHKTTPDTAQLHCDDCGGFSRTEIARIH